MIIKMITLNLWRYYDWEIRKDALIHFLKGQNADVILFQEAQFDKSFGDKNQVQYMSDKLGYSNSCFVSTGLKYVQRGVPLSYPVQIGQGIISKWPLLDMESIFLSQAADDKEKRVLLNFGIEKMGTKVHFTNLHFSNRDDWAESHFKEMFDLLNSRSIPRILSGDFNIKNLRDYRRIYDSTHMTSIDMGHYFSYPKKNETLDYILIPKAYAFHSFQCLDMNISDHNPLVAEILV